MNGGFAIPLLDTIIVAVYIAEDVASAPLGARALEEAALLFSFSGGVAQSQSRKGEEDNLGYLQDC